MRDRDGVGVTAPKYVKNLDFSQENWVCPARQCETNCVIEENLGGLVKHYKKNYIFCTKIEVVWQSYVKNLKGSTLHTTHSHVPILVKTAYSGENYTGKLSTYYCLIQWSIRVHVPFFATY